MRAAKLLVIVVLTIGPLGTVAQSPEDSVEIAFQRFQSQSPTEIKQTSEQLVREGKSDPKAREYIVLRMPPMIEKGAEGLSGTLDFSRALSWETQDSRGGSCIGQMVDD